MAYNEILANRIREQLVDLPHIEEKEMMGGLTFMVNDKMCIGIIKDEMMWAYTHFGEDIYKDLKKFRLQIERHLNTNEVKLSSTNKNKLLSQEFWKEQLNIMTCAETLAKHFGDVQFDDYNKFSVLLNKTIILCNPI